MITELNEINEILGIDYQNIEDYEKEARTPYLKMAMDHIIRSAVIIEYKLIDENLHMLICDYFFGKKKNYTRLWKTKKFQSFNQYILEKLFPLNKLELAQQICKIPENIVNDIYKINDLRNGLAHSFFPENLRKNKPIYKGKRIHTSEGIKLFMEDSIKLIDSS